MQVIIFQQEDGTVAVLFPAPEYADQLEAIGHKDVPDGCSWRIVNMDELPAAPQEAWVWSDDGPISATQAGA